MFNKLTLTIILFLFFKFMIIGQETKDHKDIQVIVDQFIDGINKGDTLLLGKIIDPNVGFLTVFHDSQKSILTADVVEAFFEGIAAPRNVEYHEEQKNCIIYSDGIIAAAWCEYVFYIEKKISHCGINAYQLYKTKKGWKIIQTTDSRHNINCQPFEKN